MKWLYHCNYCGDRTLDDEKKDTIQCRYCEHTASRLEDAQERLSKVLDQELRDEAKRKNGMLMEHAYNMLHPKERFWKRWFA